MKVLFADDKKNWHMLIDMVLGRRNLDVEHSYTVSETVSKVSSENPDVLVLDVSLQDGTAYDVIPQIQGKVPIVVVGYVKEGFDEARLSSLGVIPLKKPFTVDDLLTAMEKAKSQPQQAIATTEPLTSPAIAAEQVTIEPAETMAPQPLEIQPVEPQPQVQPQPLELQPVEIEPSSQQSVPAIEPVSQEPPVIEPTVEPSMPQEISQPEPQAISEPQQIEPPSSFEIQPQQDLQPQLEPQPELQPTQQQPKNQFQPQPLPEPEPQPEREAQVDLQPQEKTSTTPALTSSVSEDDVRAKLEEVIREIVWEVVPEIAEKVIREEIEKLIKSRLA